MLIFQDIANTISLAYIAGFLIAIGLALYFIKPAWGKVIGALVVTGGFAYPILATVIPEQRAMKERIAFSNEAWNYFRKKCDDESGVKIQKTFSGVKSVLILKPLPQAGPGDLNDQYWYGDPYSSTSWGEDRSISAALKFVVMTNENGEKTRDGFEFVEMKREDGTAVRYQRLFNRLSPPNFRLEDIQSPTSKFGITWEDISKPDDRKYWVAGSRLRIIDLTDNSVVVERVGFLIESGFGSHAGGRRPWSTASFRENTSCPRTHDMADRQLVLKVLQPLGENQNGK